VIHNMAGDVRSYVMGFVSLRAISSFDLLTFILSYADPKIFSAMYLNIKTPKCIRYLGPNWFLWFPSRENVGITLYKILLSLSAISAYKK